MNSNLVKTTYNSYLKLFVVTCLLMVISFFAGNNEVEASFKDVPENHWGHDAVDYAYNKGIIKGYSDGTFRPTAKLSEGHLVKMLVIQMYPTELEDYVEKYALNYKTYEYYPYYKLLADKGYKMTGLDNKKVAYSLTTRINTAKLIYFVMNNQRAYTNNEAIKFLIEKGITTESIDNFRENQSLLRVQGVAFIYRINDVTNEENQNNDDGDSSEDTTAPKPVEPKPPVDEVKPPDVEVTPPPVVEVTPPTATNDIVLHNGYGINIKDSKNLTIFKNNAKVGEVAFKEGTKVNGYSIGQYVTPTSFKCNLEGDYSFDLSKDKSTFKRAVCNDGKNSYYYYIDRLDGAKIEFIITLKNENKDFMDFSSSFNTISQGELNQLMTFLVNTVRKDSNALKYDVELAQVSKYHSDNMANQGFFNHIDLEGNGPGERANAFNYEYSSLAENIANIGFSLFEVHLGFLNSSDHLGTMLNMTYTNIGSGFAISPKDKKFIVTQKYSTKYSDNPFDFGDVSGMSPE